MEAAAAAAATATDGNGNGVSKKEVSNSQSTSSSMSATFPANPLLERNHHNNKTTTATTTTSAFASTKMEKNLKNHNANNDNHNHDNYDNQNNGLLMMTMTTTMNRSQQMKMKMEELSPSPSPLTSTSGLQTGTLTVESLPDNFHKSPEPILARPAATTATTATAQQHQHQQQHGHHPPSVPNPLHSSGDHHFHLLRRIREDQISNDDPGQLPQESSSSNASVTSINIGTSTSTSINTSTNTNTNTKQYHHHHHQEHATASLSASSLSLSSSFRQLPNHKHFQPCFRYTKVVYAISTRFFQKEDFAVSTWLGFWAMLHVTCANYVLTPMRDAVALQVGVQHIPKLTLASSVLAFLSSVPIGWLFEAPDPSRRKLWKKMGLTRGQNQGSSLALFYRFFALSVLSYAVGFQLVDLVQNGSLPWLSWSRWFDTPFLLEWVPFFLSKLGHIMYIAFFLVVHLMKLHSISLVWGVTTEAMEYEEVARKGQERQRQRQQKSVSTTTTTTLKKSKTRLQRLALVGFGGTIGGISGSLMASSLANILRMPGLLVIAAFLLEIAAELSVELGKVMQKHWEEQQIFKSTQDLASLDPSMKRSGSLGSMKRVASGNSLYATNMKRVASGNSIAVSGSAASLSELDPPQSEVATDATKSTASPNNNTNPLGVDDNTFTQRLLRGIKTILRSRLLMAIFTYNALLASTTVLLSFQRAELVANRNTSASTISADMAFLANINIVSSMAVFAMQASGIGAFIAHKCGSRGSLALMPLIRLFGVLSLGWWHRTSQGKPPNLVLFLMLDEFTRVVNLAIAKPVRESLWRGLSNEARYEAKPIVDTLANRWGAGSASFCVSMVNKALLWAGIAAASAEPEIFGLPPVLFLCLLVSGWWAMVSVDLGHIRKRIDTELKKHQ